MRNDAGRVKMDMLASLEAFITVVEEGGFAPAGRKLALATSSVTRQIDGLEKVLGTQLLTRSTRSVALTAAGHVYFEHAVRILNDLEYANQEVRDQTGEPRGVLRISLPVSFSRLHIAPLLAPFSRRYPLISQRRCVCASPDYLKVQGYPDAPGDLKNHNCLIFSYSSGKTKWYFNGESQVAIDVKGTLKCNNSEILREAVLSGYGIALLPDWLIGKDIAEGKLIRLLPQWRAEVNDGEDDSAIYAIYHPTRRNTKKVKVFVDFLMAHLSPEPESVEH